MSLRASMITKIATTSSRIRTLVVNHSPASIAAISTILERDQRIDVVATAQDGIIGLRTAMAQAPDLIVMDADAACLTGLEPAESLKERVPGAKIMIVFGDDDRHLARIAKVFGADALLLSSRLSAECESQLVRLFPA